MRSFTLDEVLNDISESQSEAGKKMAALISKSLKNVRLNYAETILLTYGIRTGTADCSLPPYVLHEAESNISQRESIIRSELLEFLLGDVVGESDFDFFKIEGAQIMPMSYFNTLDEVTLGDEGGESVRSSDDEYVGASFYSLNLEGKTLSVDVLFFRCGFFSGINLSNANMEGFILEKCYVGKTKVKTNSSSLGMSFFAENVTLKGELYVIGRPNFLVGEKREVGIEGCILLNYGVFGASVLLEDILVKGGISMKSARVENRVSLWNSTVSGYVFAEQNKYGFFGTGLVCDFLTMSNVFMAYKVNVVSARIRRVFSCVGAKLHGDGFSLEAGGLIANDVYLRDRFEALHGVSMHKAVIEKDLDCGNALIGFTTSWGPCMSFVFRNSQVKNAYFCDGLVAVGMIDLFCSSIDNLYFRRGLFVDVEETGLLSRSMFQKSYSIYAGNSVVSRQLSFNLLKLCYEYDGNQGWTFQGKYHIRRPAGELVNLTFDQLADAPELIQGVIRAILELKKEGVDYENEMLSSDLSSSKYMQALLLYKSVLYKMISIVLPYVEMNETRQDGMNDDQRNFVRSVFHKFCIRVIAKYALFNFHYLLNSFPIASWKRDGLNRYGLIFGEANFERTSTAGVFDAAGGIFLRQGVKDEVSKRANIWKVLFHKWVGAGTPAYEESCSSSLVISHAKIDGTLYLNCGDDTNKLPFIARGEVDLQYCAMEVFSITPALAIENARGVRWNLIGASYKTIRGQYDGNSDPVMVKSAEWIYPYFYRDDFRQPYEQLSNALFQSGDDVGARQIIVNKSPDRSPGEAGVSRAVRAIFKRGFPIENTVLSFLILVVLGAVIFWGAERCGLLADQYKLRFKGDQAEFRGLGFEPISFTFQKLMPFIQGEQETTFVAVYNDDNWIKNFVFGTFYNLYPVSGAFLVTMFVLCLARVRKHG